MIYGHGTHPLGCAFKAAWRLADINA